MLRVVVLRVLFFVDMRLSYSGVTFVHYLKRFYVKLDADQLIRYLRHN